MTDDPFPENFRLAVLAFNGFTLRLFRNMRELSGLDLETYEVLLTVAVASTQRAVVDDKVRADHPGPDPLPTDLLVGISRRAIAEATGIPRETVRRKIALLASKDLVRTNADGDVVLNYPLKREENRIYFERAFREVNRLSRRFAALGFLDVDNLCRKTGREG